MTMTIALMFAVQIAGAEVIVCPAKWAPAPGWTQRGAAPGGQNTDAGVMVGPLHLNGELRGVDHPVKNGTEVHFTGLNEYVEPVQKWAYCSYGRDGARLVHRLRENIAECVATRASMPGTTGALITCKSDDADRKLTHP